MKRLLCLLCFLGTSFLVCAEETLSVCFNYGCLNQAEVTFSPMQLDEVQARLADATDRPASTGSNRWRSNIACSSH